MRFLSTLLMLGLAFSTTTVSPTPTRTRALSLTGTGTHTPTFTVTGTRGLPTGTRTQTGTLTSTLTQTNTVTNTLTQTSTTTQTPTQTPTIRLVTQETQDQSTSVLSIIVGSAVGGLALVSVVILAIVYRPKPRPIHFTPTMMNVPIVANENPLSSRILFPRGLTTMTD